MKKRKKKERILPMPTEEDKKRAQLKAKSADPLVWAMKNVDDEFPDAREKDVETLQAEAEVEMIEPAGAREVEAPEKTEEISTAEIQAEGKVTVPMNDGVVTMEVTPMRQNVDDVPKEEKKPEPEAKAVNVSKPEKSKSDNSKSDNSKSDGSKSEANGKTQTKITALESKQKKMMIGLVVLVILALGGVAFGVVAMINQNNATLELANQIANNSTTYENQVDDDYIYLKDWGLKIKIIGGLTNVSFDYDNGDYDSVLIWGARKDDGANYVPDFAKQSKNGSALGTITRVPRYERAAAGRLIWYDDYYNYYYQGPTGEPAASEDEMSWWVESYLLVKEMLTDADNYMKFD